MAALILLKQYAMKKKSQRKHVSRSSEIPATHGELMEFRNEMNSRFSSVDQHFKEIHAKFDAVDARFEAIDARFEAIDARFEAIDARFDAIDARFEAMDAKIDKRFNELSAKIDRMLMIVEEQNARNKYVFDGYVAIYEKVNNLEARIKPECLKD